MYWRCEGLKDLHRPFRFGDSRSTPGECSV